MAHIGAYKQKLNTISKLIEQGGPTRLPADIPQLIKDCYQAAGGQPALAELLAIAERFPGLVGWYAGDSPRPCGHEFSRLAWERRNLDNQGWHVWGVMLARLLTQRLSELGIQPDEFSRDPVTALISDTRHGLLAGLTPECTAQSCRLLDPERNGAQLAAYPGYEAAGRDDWDKFIITNGFDSAHLNDITPTHEAAEFASYIEITSAKYE